MADASLSPRRSCPLPPLPPPSTCPLNTYIIQIPRDQIYRIPPPENEIILRNIDTEASKRRNRCDPRCICWTTIIFGTLILVGILYSVFGVYFRPQTPEFSVVELDFRKGSSGSKHANPSYDITLRTRNPNTKMDIFYEKGGNVSLLFKHDRIGGGGEGGEYPSIAQASMDSTNIHVTLAGQNQTRMKASERPILLSLVISEPIQLKGLVTFKKHLTVVCDFRVNTFDLSKKPKILSQECHTNF